ncbi:MAG: helix-turn-helix domain-containing protein [bacterium]
MREVLVKEDRTDLNLLSFHNDDLPRVNCKTNRRDIFLKGIFFRENMAVPLFSLKFNKTWNIKQVLKYDEIVSISHSNKVDILICCFEKGSSGKAKLCKRLKSMNVFAHIPLFVLLPVPLSLQTRMLFLQAGANEVLTVPNELPLLNCKIDGMIRFRDNLKTKLNQKNDIDIEQVVHIKDDFIRDAMKTLMENLTDPAFSALKFSKKMNISRSTMFRKFKEATGLSPNELIIETRLKTAAKILREKKTSISCLAYDLGFSSPSYFTKIFRLKYKMPPSAYYYYHSGRK